MNDDLPVLLPTKSLPSSSWRPSKYLDPPNPPPQDEGRLQDTAMAVARQVLDGKALKKTRPRRTVDYNGGIGRWILNRKARPNPYHVPHLRPSPPYIIDLLPPKAYDPNPSTSLCTKFVHTSTNKIRCPVNCITWTPEGRRVLTGSTSGEFTLWNGLTFNFETILQAHDNAIRTMTFTHSGAYLASADQTGVIKYFQPNMNNLTAWNAHREAVRGLSFSPDDSRFATASDDSTVRIWDFEESREERVLTGHGWDVRCVEWHPTKGLLVSGSKDNLVKFWDPRTGTCLSTLHQHKNTIQALAWSPGGDLVATASRDQTVRLFDIRAMKEYRVLKGHKKEVCSLAWHPIHPILISGGSEGALLYWDINAPEQVPGSNTPAGPRATLSQAHDSNVWALAFHPLGHILASASNDHTTRFWSRERPGDVSSVFSGGGQKPPEALDGGAQEEDDDLAVPGFSYLGTGNDGPQQPGLGGGSTSGGNWWGKDEEGSTLPGLGFATSTGNGTTTSFPTSQSSPAWLADGNNNNSSQARGGPNGIDAFSSGADDGNGIPGFGRSMDSTPVSSGSYRQQNNGPPQDSNMHGHNHNDEWNRGNSRSGRWGPRRGGRY